MIQDVDGVVKTVLSLVVYYFAVCICCCHKTSVGTWKIVKLKIVRIELGSFCRGVEWQRIALARIETKFVRVETVV